MEATRLHDGIRLVSGDAARDKIVELTGTHFPGAERLLARAARKEVA